MLRFLFLIPPALFLGACSPSETPVTYGDNLKLLETHELKVPEPSGVSLGDDGKSLWIVSDEAGAIHQVSLRGDPIQELSADETDVEGIANLGDGRLAVIAERGRKLVILDAAGNRLTEEKLAIPGEDNSGPEAVAFNRQTREFYVLKEKNPGLFVILDENLRETGRKEFRFARDYSALDLEPVRQHLWVLSDESQSIHVFDHGMDLITTFSTSIPQAEGLAVDYPNKRLYLVSDATAKLYVFSFENY